MRTLSRGSCMFLPPHKIARFKTCVKCGWSTLVIRGWSTLVIRPLVPRVLWGFLVMNKAEQTRVV